MNLIHSTWTKPMIKNRWQIKNQLKSNIWLYAYSVLCAKRIGAKITLHTDSYGSRYFGKLGYDEVKITLDVLNNLSSKFWAVGKMIAIEKEPLGSIHIDGDVFLKRKTLNDVFNFDNYDVIVQCEERLGIFMAHYLETIHHYPKALKNIPNGFNKDLKHSLNCGVFGFKNQKVKDEYLKGFFSMVDQLKASTYFMKVLNDNEKFEPNIMIEQFYLAGLCHKNNLRIKYVLPLKSDASKEKETIEEMNSVANEIGYAHAWGSTKYDLIPEIKNKIRNQDTAYFKKVERIINTI